MREPEIGAFTRICTVGPRMGRVGNVREATALDRGRRRNLSEASIEPKSKKKYILRYPGLKKHCENITQRIAVS